MEVDSAHLADVVVYKTNNKKESQEWDLMWRFKGWGFSNFSIYIVKDSTELEYYDEETNVDHWIEPAGKIYFTENKEERRYIEDYQIPGIMKRKREDLIKLEN